MGLVLTFPQGARVRSAQTGEVLYEYDDEPLRIHRGRLVPVRDAAVVYAVHKARWIARQLARHPGLSPSQLAMGRRLKRDLARLV